MNKKPPLVSLSDARELLECKENEDVDNIRKQYRKLARKYHPDKNPEGRDVFDKIQEAYELLILPKHAISGPDPIHLQLIIKTQVNIFLKTD